MLPGLPLRSLQPRYHRLAPLAVTSAIATDATTYVAGDDMALTVTLMDAQDNLVTGASTQLTATAVTVEKPR